LATSELVWMLVSFILTLMVFSFIFGDNPVFRFTLAILVGTTAGYFAVILLQQVIAPKLIFSLQSGGYQLTAIPIILSLLLVLRLIPRYARVGNISLGVIVGTAAAVIIGGAIFGTLLPQLGASIQQFSSWRSFTSGEGVIKLLEGGLVLLGTITSLMYFQFTQRKKKQSGSSDSKLSSAIRSIGKFFIVVTLGAVFAGVFSASITALVSRLAFLWESVRFLIG
jgi:hypothetical protein